MLFVFVVFFFKQKTAYEMRISDWSSDVCSSDFVAVVIDLDPLGRPLQLEHLRQSAEVAGLGAGLGEAAVQLLLRVAGGLADHLRVGAALGHPEGDRKSVV